MSDQLPLDSTNSLSQSSEFSDLGNDSQIISSSSSNEDVESNEPNSQVLEAARQELLGFASSPVENTEDSEDLDNTRALTFISSPRVPSFKDILISSAINLVLPFINGMMLGFGEIFAHELGFKWGWASARVSII